MSKNLFENTFLQKEIDNLNEMADEYTIYDESQCGPQEEPYVKEYKLDVKKWRIYHKKKMSKWVSTFFVIFVWYFDTKF